MSRTAQRALVQLFWATRTCALPHRKRERELQHCSQGLAAGDKIDCQIQTINSPKRWCLAIFLVPCWDDTCNAQNWGPKLQTAFYCGNNLPLTLLPKNAPVSKSSFLWRLFAKRTPDRGMSKKKPRPRRKDLSITKKVLHAVPEAGKRTEGIRKLSVNKSAFTTTFHPTQSPSVEDWSWPVSGNKSGQGVIVRST